MIQKGISQKAGFPFVFWEKRRTAWNEMGMPGHIVKKKAGAGIMLNGIWAVMMIAGILFGILNGNASEVTQAALKSAAEAVSLCITMLGVMSLWTGI